jgi:hypothetical protein
MNGEAMANGVWERVKSLNKCIYFVQRNAGVPFHARDIDAQLW